jgi:hypothetical protein
MGVFVTVFSATVDNPVRAVGFRTRPAGSMNMVEEVRDSGVHAHEEGSLLVVTIRDGFTLEQLLGIRPASIHLDRVSRFPQPPRAWIRPTYEP